MNAPNEKLTDLYRRGKEMMAPDEPPQPDITAWAAGAFGASPELTAAWLAFMEAGIKSGEMPGWRPVESAPWHTEILIGGVDQGVWWQTVYTIRHDHWREEFEFTSDEPTFWHVLPAPPSDPKQDRSRADETGGE